MRTRPADAADENETAGQEGYSETFHTITSMNKELERYIEREIIPRYEDFDAAHRTDHVRTVIAQRLELAARALYHRPIAVRTHDHSHFTNHIQTSLS